MKARLLIAVALLLPTLAHPQNAQNAQNTHKAQARPTTDKQFFGLDKIWDIHITITKESWRSMFPEGGMVFGFAQQRPKFPYGKARIQIAGHPAIDVGIRFKGHSSYSSSRGTLKRPFKVDFNRYVKTQSFLGLKKLNLNNNATDTTQIREAVCYEAYRQAGIPACRTAFARVHLTIQGQTKRVYLGLYTIIEQVDRGFLQRQIGKKGTILKPEMQILGYYGDTWNEEYERTYLPKSQVKPEHAEAVIGLARLADAEQRVWGGGRGFGGRGGFGGGRGGFGGQRGGSTGEVKDPVDRKAFAKSLEQVLDVDQFLRYVAITGILANWDNPLTIAHNIYLVVPDGSTRVLWVPWDLNLALSTNRMNMSILEPGRLPLMRGVLAVESYKKAYRKHVRSLVEGCCSAAALTRSIQLARKTTQKAIADEAQRVAAVTQAGDDPGSRRRRFGGGRGRMQRPSQDLVALVQQREKSVKDQLDGKEVPRQQGFGFGFGGGRQGGGNRGFAGGFQRETPAGTLRNVLVTDAALKSDGSYKLPQVLAAVKQSFVRLDKNRSQSLEGSELRAAVRAHTQRRARQGAQPNIFSPGYRNLARRLRRDLDADRDGRVTAAEWEAGCKKYFKTWDADKDGTIRGTEIVPAGIRRR